ncbi:hypothetical protein HPP92_001128 [Vanilla planifolia]|uniref:Uncharacterized protein n=1 Tax=Vanilla planifolia TaxID=51239 RepID=A0A835S2R4_VANPL|nr:hypothetical protein HPP92_001128 [Vanilla planifolia]
MNDIVLRVLTGRSICASIPIPTRTFRARVTIRKLHKREVPPNTLDAATFLMNKSIEFTSQIPDGSMRLIESSMERQQKEGKHDRVFT